VDTGTRKMELRQALSHQPSHSTE